MISQKIAEIQSKIAVMCIACGLRPSELKVVAVTKYTNVDDMKQAVEAGICDLGENRIQDAKEKFAILEDQNIKCTKHMIGHLQTNKVKEAVALFDMIQSVDSLKVAKEIDKQAVKLNKVMDVLVQVNSSYEGQKSGIVPDQTIKLLQQVSELEHVRVLGLMTIGLLTDDQLKIKDCFDLTKNLFDQAEEKFKGHERTEMRYLSMGMSQDYELAISCGANMVRIGSAIFS